MMPSLKVLADDGVVTPEYLLQLENKFRRGSARAQKEAWQWFVLSCWYQVNIRQADPFAMA